MASLTETARVARKVIKFGGIGLIVLIVLRIAIKAGLDYWQKLHPPPKPPPNIAFNKLPKIKFEEKEIPTVEYILETPTGTFPSFDDQAYVFYAPYQKESLMALDRGKARAKKLGFLGEPNQKSASVWEWRKNVPLLKTLQMDIYSNQFEISYQWQNDERILLEKQLPGKQQAIIECKNFLSGADFLPDDLDVENAKIFYLKAVGGKFVSTVSLSEADFVKVEIYRKDIKNLPVLTPKFNKGIVEFTISGSKSPEKRIVKVEYNYLPTDYNTWGTYPLKSPSTAWEDLKNKKGFIVNQGENKEKVTIRRIYLAYLDTFEPQRFLQPIIVFEGDNNFLGFVPAVLDKWIKTE